MAAMSQPLVTTDRTKVRRLPDRGTNDRTTAYEVIDEAYLAHVGFVVDGDPRVLPMTYGRDGEEYGFRGCFHEVRPNELIVQTFTFEGQPDQVALEKLALEDLGNGRTRLVATSLVDSFEDRDAFVASGMESGVVQGYEALDELLAG